MVPLFCRYLLKGYLKIFALSVCTFVSVLIVSRFKEIARFTALSGNWLKTALFIFYQIPFILPLAIPISALVSSFLLFQRLSRNYELVAFRASGFSFQSLVSPLLCAAFFLACFNFSFCADLSPFCWRKSRALLYKETSANPLLLMQRQNLVKIKHAYVKMDVKDDCAQANDFMLIAYNKSNRRLNFFSAKQLKIEGSELLGYGLSILTHLQSEDLFDPLLIENQKEMSTKASILSAALKKHRPRAEPNALGLRLLCCQMREEGKKGPHACIEIMRRISLTVAVFTFTLLGCAFGIEPARRFSKMKLIWTLLLAATVFMTYLGLKEMKGHPVIAFFCTLIPHLLIGICSIGRIALIARGRDVKSYLERLYPK
ncbi:MAG TPA: LptF/LptG family permease [Chlamydiales bacterium]|nr:LptF/LptG family permease [Chlamydiales bacterium]